MNRPRLEPAIFEATREGYTLSTDRERIDPLVVWAFLSEAYWSSGRTREHRPTTVRRAGGDVSFACHRQSDHQRKSADRQPGAKDQSFIARHPISEACRREPA